MTKKFRIAILGSGRMGQAIQRCIRHVGDIEMAGMWSRSQSTAGLQSVLSDADVAIDFTLPEATNSIVEAVLAARVPLVSGVSGLSGPAYQQLADAGNAIPLLHDRNMSLGVAVMQRMVKMAASSFGMTFKAAIHETHHVHKVDAPSGTALQLGEALAEGRGQEFSQALHYDPEGKTRAQDGQIAFTVDRLGEVCGEHTVMFSHHSESLSVEHKVLDRQVFAEGAIVAAKWLVTKPPGFYSMQDVVG